MNIREALDALESKIAQGDMTAAQVFTQMKQLVQAALSANGGEAVAELDRAAIEEAMVEGGWWKPCTGCHETVDGQTIGSGRRTVFGCEAGGGCDECGGIGVIWEEAPTDEQLALLSADPDTHPAPPSVAVPVAWVVFADNGNIRIWGREKPEAFPDAAPLYLAPTVKGSLTIEDFNGMCRIVEAVSQMTDGFAIDQCHMDRAREIVQDAARLRTAGDEGEGV